MRISLPAAAFGAGVLISQIFFSLKPLFWRQAARVFPTAAVSAFSEKCRRMNREKGENQENSPKISAKNVSFYKYYNCMGLKSMQI
ncbi:MAG: hypothetical protein NC541_13265 [bacterium]|nr:hypothetical protein [bacterium]